jgi:hypothetical protein
MLAQMFVESAEPGCYTDGASGLWLSVTDRGARYYEVRHNGEHRYLCDADEMMLPNARRLAAEVLAELKLEQREAVNRKPLWPADLHRYLNAWVRESLAAAAAELV